MLPQSANLPPPNAAPFLQNSSRFILGFSLKLSHAPLQGSCSQNHKITTFIKSVFRRV
jgi:hypothetical protein